MTREPFKRWDVYLVDLNPVVGTKPGKVRPCVVVQNDTLNSCGHTSTVLVPITSNLQNKDFWPLRVFLPAPDGGMEKDSSIMVDQIISWDNRRYVKKIGSLSVEKANELRTAIIEFFDFW